MHVLFTLGAQLEKIVAAIGRASSWLIIPLMLVIVFDVIMRRFFVIGSTQLQEMEWHLHGALFLLCLGWAYTKDSHIRIELIREKLSYRLRAFIELIGCLLFLLPYCWVLIYFGADYFEASFAFNESSPSATGLPFRWIIKGVMVIGFASLFLAGLSRTLMAIAFLWGPKSLHPHTGFTDRHEQEGVL